MDNEHISRLRFGGSPINPKTGVLSMCPMTRQAAEHWRPEVQARLAAEMQRTRLSLKNFLLGVVYAWTRLI